MEFGRMGHAGFRKTSHMVKFATSFYLTGWMNSKVEQSESSTSFPLTHHYLTYHWPASSDLPNYKWVHFVGFRKR